MARILKFKQGDKVIYRSGIGSSWGPGRNYNIKEIKAEVIFANNRTEWLRRYSPYIIRTKSCDIFVLERDLKPLPNEKKITG